jgi:Uma2 family endonuclease
MSEEDKTYIRETADNRLYTYGDYLKWNDEKRYELINGKVYIMTPAPCRQYQKVLGELFTKVSVYLSEKECEVYVAPFDVRLPEGEEREEDIKTVVQPDIVVICDKSKLDKRGCKGAPDLVIEVLSPSSASRDRKIKRDLYEKHGVREYWLVNYLEKVVEVFLLNEDNKYGKPAVYLEDDEVPVSILSGLNIKVSHVFRE